MIPRVVEKRFKETRAADFTLPKCTLHFTFENHFLKHSGNIHASTPVFLRCSSNYFWCLGEARDQNQKDQWAEKYTGRRDGKLFNSEVKLEKSVEIYWRLQVQWLSAACT